ncbi:MAG: EAL domain-containing protein [Ruminococcus sp.]|nr:EAL domain-containing protein [Ruminococcus sp.]
MGNNKETVRSVEYGRYIVDLDQGGIIVEIMDSFTKITGYTLEELQEKNTTFIDFLPKSDREDYIKYIRAIQAGEMGAFLQHRFVKKNGDIIPILCFGDDFTAENGHQCSKITICDVSERVRLEAAYTNTKEELGALMQNVPGGVALYEIVGDELIILKANDEYYRIFGYGSAENHPSFGGKTFKRSEVLEYTNEAAAYIHTLKTLEKDVLFKKSDGKSVWLKLRSRFLGQTERGNYIICVVFIDITESKRNERELINQAERLKLIVENTDEIFYEYYIDSDTMVFSNCINRYTEEDNKIVNFLNGEKYKDYIFPEDQEMVVSKMRAVGLSTQRGSITYRTRAFDDDYTWYKAIYVSVSDDTGKPVAIYGRLFSVEHEQKLRSRIVSDKEEIERLTNTDQVTGLLTRKAFKAKAAQMLKERFDDKHCFAMVYSDINDFSYVNDNFGFEAGNEMLRDFATGINTSPQSLVGCRIYSDFFVSLAIANSREELVDSIKRVSTAFSTEQKLKYSASDLHISTGVYFIPSADADITIAIDNADLARRSVKGVKEIPCGIYSERMRKQRSHEQQIAAELKNALMTGQVELFLQPKFSLDTRKIIGAEALARWRNPDGSYKLPYEFISVLEKVGYIVDLDMYMYETLLKTMARWRREGYTLLPISINFSRNHAAHRNFVDRLTALAEFYGIEPNLIEVEITESAFMQDFNSLYNDMKKLREHGFKIDIDDFGMGYSSLSVLLYAPVDIVKVDKAFIDNIASSSQARDYVNQICSLINLTNKAIVFEGVETEAQAQILADSGHKMAQGWLFDKAISVTDFENKYMKPQLEKAE